jgi:hypothetical protein
VFADPALLQVGKEESMRRLRFEDLRMLNWRPLGTV